MPDREHPTWQVMIAALASKTDEQTAALSELTEATREQTNAFRERTSLHQWALYAVVFLVGFGLTVIGYGVFTARHLSQQNHRLAAQINDCTIPGPDHVCYQRSQRQTATAIDLIVTRTITAICTGFHPDHPELVPKCVARALMPEKP